MTTRVSPQDVYGLLSHAKREGWIGGYRRIQSDGVRWRIRVPSTHYDRHHGFHWTEIVLTSREACVFLEGCYAAAGRHPITRPGAYRASWEEGHIMPPVFSPQAQEARAAMDQGYSGPCALERHAECMSPLLCVCECHTEKPLLPRRTMKRA